MVNCWANAKLEDLLDYIQPTNYIVNSTEYSDEYKIPVLTAGKSFIKGYTNETDGVFDQFPAIIFDDFTTAIQFVNFQFKVKSSAMKILVLTSKLIDIRYVFYLMKTLKVNTITHKRYWISVFSKLPVKIASTSEQKIIADHIDEVLSDLDNAVENFKKVQEQLKVYRQAVLRWAFGGKAISDLRNWKKTTLGEIISISSGDGLTKSKRNDEGQYLVYGGNGITGNHSEYLFEQEKLIIGRVGAHCGNVHITKSKSWVTDNAFVVTFDEKSFDINYLYYLIISLNLNKYSSSTAQPVISQGKVYPIEVVVPIKKEDQRSLVFEIALRLSICDKTEELIIDNLQRAEALRQSIFKQAFEGKLTEHWRNKHYDMISGENSAEALLKKIKADKETLEVKSKGRKNND